MNFRGGSNRSSSIGGNFGAHEQSAGVDMSFEEAMEAARFADLGGLITAEDYETPSVSTSFGSTLLFSPNMR